MKQGLTEGSIIGYEGMPVILLHDPEDGVQAWNSGVGAEHEARALAAKIRGNIPRDADADKALVGDVREEICNSCGIGRNAALAVSQAGHQQRAHHDRLWNADKQTEFTPVTPIVHMQESMI